MALELKKCFSGSYLVEIFQTYHNEVTRGRKVSSSIKNCNCLGNYAAN